MQELMLFCISKTKNNELAHTEKPSPLVGEGVSEADGRGKCEQNRKKGFLRSNIKYLPVILERSEESG